MARHKRAVFQVSRIKSPNAATTANSRSSKNPIISYRYDVPESAQATEAVSVSSRKRFNLTPF